MAQKFFQFQFHYHLVPPYYKLNSSNRAHEMFLSRKDWTIAITVAYLFLIFLFAVVKDDQGVKPCNWYDSCVSFCCQNSSACSDDSVTKSFNASAHGLVVDPDEPLIILRGRPKCSLEAIPEDQFWRFEYVIGFKSLK